MSDNLRIAREEIDAGRVRKALWRLEAARQEAQSAGDLELLREVVRLAAQGRAQAGPILSGRFEAVRYAAQHTLSLLEHAEGSADTGALLSEVRHARIRDDLEHGNVKAALKALWEEKISAAVAYDAERLRAVIALAALAAERSEGRLRGEARLLAGSAEAELSALERAGPPRVTPTSAPPSAPEPRAPARPRPELAVRLGELERKLEALDADYRARAEALEDELVQLWALAGAEPAPEIEEEQAPVVGVEPEPVRLGAWEEIAGFRAREEIAGLRPREEEPAPEAAPRPLPPAPAPRPLPPAPAPAPVAAAPVEAEPSAFALLVERLSQAAAERGRTVGVSVATHALAWAGGVVTLLGIVFLFVLAANRGWISPEIRVGMGAAASLAVFLAGFHLRLRQGQLAAALAAVGTGLAGSYATLLAATAHYDLVPSPAALAVAALVAAVGVATSLAWSSQLVAGLGLIGALIVAPVVQQGVHVSGGAFVVLVAAATSIVAVRKRWRSLLLLGGLLSAGQVSYVVAVSSGETDWRVVALAAAFWLLYTGTGIAYQLNAGVAKLQRLGTPFTLAGVTLAFAASAHLFDGKSHGVHREGLALLVVAAVQAALGAAVMRRGGQRDLASLLWATGAAVGGVAVGELLTGPSLTVVWSAQAALLAFLAARTGERRFQLASGAYLLSAIGYALVVQATPDTLFVASRHPAAGVPSLVFCVLAAAVFAFFARTGPGEGEGKGGHPLYRAVASWLEARAALWRAGSVWTGAALALYAVSLSLLELFEWAASGGVQLDFERGHVALTALWGVLALAGLTVGLLRRALALRAASLLLFGLALVELLAYDTSQLSEPLRWLSFLALWTTVLAAAALSQRLSEEPGRLDPAACAFLPVSLALAVPALVHLVGGSWQGIDLQGAALLGLASVHGVLAALFFRRQRDFSTLLWGSGLVLAAVAVAELVAGTRLTLLWAAAAAALAYLAVRTGERRFRVASAAYLLSAIGYAIAVEATPDTLFVAARHPASGVPSLVFCVLAAAVFARFAGAQAREGEDGHPSYRATASWLAARESLWRAGSVWAGVALAVYAFSLSLLELVEWVAQGSVRLDFERGHVALTAFWGALALAGLTVALRRRTPALQGASLVLFGLAVAELAAYDLGELSEPLRWLSCLSLWVTVLAASAVSQRLSPERGRLDPAACAFLPVSLALAVPALVHLVDGTWHGIDLQGAALLGLAAVHGALAAFFFRRQRDFSTLLWASGLVLAGVAVAELVAGTRLTLLWAAAAAALAYLSVRLSERRLQLASAVYLGCALGYALVVEAPPRNLFVASGHPASGVPSVVFCALAAAVFAWSWGFSRARSAGAGTSAATLVRSLVDQDPRWAVGTVWAAGTLALYGVSLALLGLLEWPSGADIHTAFQRGHVAVSACWGLVGLALLYAGLRRRRHDVRVGGFVVFGLIVAKVFLYDLRNLDSVARALSFLAVGALLLVAGYFYQRLTGQLDEQREEPRRPPSHGGE